MWASTTRDLDRPTWAIIDLDPREVSFGEVVRVARGIRKVCDEIGLPAYLKTSGSTGLHVLIPTGGAFDYKQTRALATLIGNLARSRDPDSMTLTRVPSERVGKVYIDCGQNRLGQTIAAPFSVRARPGAPVSMPLRWPELAPRKTNDRYTIRNALRRMARLDADPLLRVFDETPDLAAAVSSLDRLMSLSRG